MTDSGEPVAATANISFEVPLIARGKLVSGGAKSFAARAGDVTFLAPDVLSHLHQLVAQPADLEDLRKLTTADIAAFMGRVGHALELELELDKNRHLRQAYEVSKMTSGVSAPILEAPYRSMPRMFDEATVARYVETQMGSSYLDGWVELSRDPGAVTSIRAFGARLGWLCLDPAYHPLFAAWHIDLITLDPKHSASIIGREALADEGTMRKVASELAIDIGAFNQETCANARVIYVECDPDDLAALDRLNTLGTYVFDALLGGILAMGIAGPQDGLEPERRMLKWVKDVSVVGDG